LKSNEANVCADYDMFVKATPFSGITLLEINNIQFLMNQIALQNVVTQTLLPSYSFLRRTGKTQNDLDTGWTLAQKTNPLKRTHQ
jgi:hypothetical protein